MRVCGTFFLAVSTLPVAALAVDGGGHHHNVTNIPIMLRYADGASIEVNFIPGDTVEGVAADVCVKELKGVVDIDVCCRMITRLLMHEVVRSGLVDLRVGSTGQPLPPDPTTAAVWTPGPQPAHGTFLADPMQLADVAARVRDDYSERRPFPHLVMDEVFEPSVARACAREFPPTADAFSGQLPRLPPGWGVKFQFPNQHNKRYLNSELLMGPACRAIFGFIKSSVFISFLEELTGIDGLLADPHHDGGGLHQTLSGGQLRLHTDFNFNMRNRLWRRVNVFLYLNEEDGWREPVPGGPAAETCEGLGDAHCVPATSTATTTHNASTARPFTGGDLELWPEGLFPPSGAKNQGSPPPGAGAWGDIVSIPPMFNRLVVFTNTNRSIHGHPNPLATPLEISRKSLAAYFYHTDSGYDVDPAHVTTLFRDTPAKAAAAAPPGGRTGGR